MDEPSSVTERMAVGDMEVLVGLVWLEDVLVEQWTKEETQEQEARPWPCLPPLQTQR